MTGVKILFLKIKKANSKNPLETVIKMFTYLKKINKFSPHRAILVEFP